MTEQQVKLVANLQMSKKSYDEMRRTGILPKGTIVVWSLEDVVFCEQSKGAEGENVDGDVLKLSIGKDIGSPSLRIQDSHTVPVTSAPDKCVKCGKVRGTDLTDQYCFACDPALKPNSEKSGFKVVAAEIYSPKTFDKILKDEPLGEKSDLQNLVDQVLEWAKLNHELSRICTRPDEPHFIATAKRIKQAEEQAKEDGKK